MGHGGSGQLGLGNTSSTSTPTLISTLSNIVAHELGHKVGRGARYVWTDPSNQLQNFKSLTHAGMDGEKCDNYLMLGVVSPDRLRKRLTRDDWNAINFVAGSPVKINMQDSHTP